MSEPFDAFEYAAYLKARWRFFAIAAVLAGGLALAVSALVPSRYTATVSIVIEPGGDARSASVVSPVYLESLRTYETFAASDATFERAVDQFHLREANPGSPVETLKRRILEITKLRDTRILQISATLPDARQALEFAQYIARQTVMLNQNLRAELERDALEAAEKELAAAKASRETVEEAWAAFAARGSIDAMEYDLSSLSDLKMRVNRQLMSANGEVAAMEAGLGQAHSEARAGALAAAKARAAALANQYAGLEKEFARKNSEVAQMSARGELLRDNLDASRKRFENAESRVEQLRSTAGEQAERLKIVDPGAVPSRPSSPKPVRNVVAALLLALIASAIYLSAAYTAGRRNGKPAESYRIRA